MPWLIKNDDVLQLERCNNNKNHHNTTDSDDDDSNSSSNSIDVKMNQIIDIHNNDTSSSSTSSLFFVHVPRCGGTSLMHYYQLPTKIYKLYKHNYWKQLGMYTFFSRYKTLEISNFPICTIGNAFGLISIILGIYILSASNSQAFIPHLFGILFILFGLLLILLLTIIFTAPVIGRFTYVHHAYLIFVHYILCQFMECKPYCTGTNKSGYMMHLTAYKLLYTYQYVTIPQWNIACSMAIVRNPYSRMISIYTYNRFGSFETFTHFMNDWYHNVTKHYRINHICDEWFTPCHALPQFEYTHYQNQQLVKSIIKQEELKYLKNDIYNNNNNNNNTNNNSNHNNNNNTIVTASNNNNNNNSNNGDSNDNNENNNNIDTSSNNIEMTVSTNNESKMDTIHHHQQQEQQYEQTTATGEDTAEMGNPNSIITTTSSNKTDSTTTSSNNTTTAAATTNSISDTTTTTTKVLSIHNLPNTVRDALIQMPHTNQRKLSKNIKWYDYYTQHTLDLVYEIYYNDFIIFNYNPILLQRPDLQPPKLYNKLHCNNHHHHNNISNSNGNSSTNTTTNNSNNTSTNITANSSHNKNNASTNNSTQVNDIELGVS